MAERCRGCAHAAHRRACPCKGPSKCVSSEDDTGAVFMCGERPPCPCPRRACGCGQLVVLAAELPPAARRLPGEAMLVSVECGTAGRPGGLLAVRQLPGGQLACRGLAAGEQTRPGEWRGTEHTNGSCALLARCEADDRWLTLQGA